MTIEPSGKSTVLWWPRGTCIDDLACQPAEGFASSKIWVVATEGVEVVVEPPSCMTWVEPPVPPGISTAVPQSRSVGMLG